MSNYEVTNEHNADTSDSCYPGIRQCRSQAEPFNFINYQPVDPSLQFQPNIPFPYASGNQQVVPQQAFLDILNPIRPPLFSPNLMIIKSKLCGLISTNELEVGPVMDYLVKFKNLEPFDLMIAALLALRDTLPEDCPLRQELGQLIVHSIFKRCQSRLRERNGGSNRETVRPVPTETVTTPLPESPQPLSCETIANLLRYFQSLFDQYNCQQCSSPDNNVDPVYSDLYNEFSNSQQVHKRHSVEVTKSNLLEKDSLYGRSKAETIPFEQLIEILPQPQNQMESLQYNTVKQFLGSSEIKSYCKNITISDFSNKQKLLNLVLNQVAQICTDATVKDAFNFYLNYGNHKQPTRETITFNYTTLIDLLPQPLDNEEKEKIAIVKSVLARDDIHKFLKNVDVSLYNDKKLLLKTVLKEIVVSNLDVKTTEAFTYYLNYEESLTPLELYTKKEITKHFELTKIFIDTLDLDSLSTDAKLAFKKFFKFISNITGDQIKSFDTWTEVKTKGEFMKALFKYLSAQTFVPQEVKDCISKLEPLVKMVGKGAAPP